MVTERRGRRLIDPALTLAVAIQGAPGAYAVLVGSGVSRSAGIPTGWEVTLDLAAKVARSMGEDPGAAPDVWFARRFSREPGYSELLQEISKSPVVRSRLLRGYFEPTVDERAAGLKTPTAAHRALADLAAGGYLRVIVTTNFDRLIETALEERGVQPVVISTPDGLAGAPSVSQVDCLVLKLHGDYRDSRILNTEAELAKYDTRVRGFLDRLIEAHGWVVVGWSAEWDPALRAAFERSKSRRYPTFWASVGQPGEAARRLIRLRSADLAPITDADAFLGQLAAQVAAVADTGRQAPITSAAAVAALKRYLPDPQHRIRLADLVND